MNHDARPPLINLSRVPLLTALLVAAILAWPASSPLPGAGGLPAADPYAPLGTKVTAPYTADAAAPDGMALVEPIRQRATPSPDHPEVLAVEGDSYRARFTPRGLQLVLRTRGQMAADGAASGPQAYAADPEFELALTMVRWGTHRAAPAPLAFNGTANRVERAAGPGLTEVFTAHHDHLEWDLRLDRPLAPGQDLRVEASVGIRGANAAPPSTAPDLRWAIDDARAVRMGDLTVIDANGRSLAEVKPQVVAHASTADGSSADTRIAFTIPAGVLDGAAYPVLLDPVLTPEYAVSDRLHEEGADNDQVAVDVAAYGSNYLVVWEDNRFGGNDIWGAIIYRPTGALTDPAGFRICTAPGVQAAPKAVTAGSSFLVVWEDWRNGNADIYAARLTSAGALLDGPPESGGIPISTGTGDQIHPAVASTTYYVIATPFTQRLIVWEDYRSGAARIRGTRFTSSVLDGPPESGGLLISDNSVSTQPCAAGLYADEQYVVAYRNSVSDLTVKVIDRYGALVTTGYVNGHQRAYYPSAASNGSQFLVAWEEHWGSLSYSNITGALMQWDGAAWSYTELALCTYNWDQLFPDVSHARLDYVVVWEDHRSASTPFICGTRVDESGVVSDVDGVAMSTSNRWRPAVAATWNGMWLSPDYWILGMHAWSLLPGDTSMNIAAARFASAIRDDASDISVSCKPNNQYELSLAFSGQNWLAVWREQGQLRCGRVDPAGNRLDGAGIVLGTGEDAQVAWLGSCFLVVFWDRGSGTIRALRVDDLGNILDAAPIVVSPAGGSDPAVAALGSTGLIVWQQGYDIHTARVDASGAVLAPGPAPLCTQAASQMEPAVAAGPGAFLVVWKDYRGTTDIYGALIDPAGRLFSAVDGFPISEAAGVQEDPAVGWSGVDFLVAWEDDRTGTGWDRNLYGARVTSSGVVRDPAGLGLMVSGATVQRDPVVAGDMGTWIVGWVDHTASTSAYDFKGRKISAAAGILESFNIAAGADAEQGGVIAGHGYLGYGYLRYATEAPYNGSSRAFLTTSGSPVSAVGELPVAADGLRLEPAVPNPFNPATTLSFATPRAGRARLVIYDLHGGVVAVPFDGTVPAGTTSVRWEGRDRAGRAVASGTYLAQVQFEGRTGSQRLQLVR